MGNGLTVFLGAVGRWPVALQVLEDGNVKGQPLTGFNFNDAGTEDVISNGRELI